MSRVLFVVIVCCCLLLLFLLLLLLLLVLLLLLLVTITVTTTMDIMVVFGVTTNTNYDQWLVHKQPTNQQTRNCHMIKLIASGAITCVAPSPEVAVAPATTSSPDLRLLLSLLLAVIDSVIVN